MSVEFDNNVAMGTCPGDEVASKGISIGVELRIDMNSAMSSGFCLRTVRQYTEKAFCC